MGKFLDYFSQQYGCEVTGTETKTKNYIKVQGTCTCASGITCEFSHTVDDKGNVVFSKENNCPCKQVLQDKSEQFENTQTTYKRKKVGQGVAIAICVVSGIIVLIGIIFIAKRSKKKT